MQRRIQFLAPAGGRSASPFAAAWHSATRCSTSRGSTLPMPVIAPVAPQLTKPWNTAVSTPIIRVTSSSRLVMYSAA